MGEQRRIVVGVGPEEVRAALAFAAEEAVRVGCGLHLVHALHVMPAGPEMALVALADVEKLGHDVLDDAVEHARRLVGRAVPVTGELVHGAPVQVLVDTGHSARMVVLEHRHLSRLSRVVNRTVAGGVAARLRTPVVAVPTGWQGRAGVPVVVAGVDVPERSHEVLVAAVDAARARGADLRVVHSWAVPTAYRELVEEGERGRWADEARARVRAALDRLGDESLAAEADVLVRTGRPSQTLLAASADAALLVVGRHDPLVPIGSHVGPVARSVLREATCPVLLVSPRGSRPVTSAAHVSGRGGF